MLFREKEQKIDTSRPFVSEEFSGTRVINEPTPRIYLYATPPERSGPDPFLDRGLTSSRHTLTERK